MKKHFASKGPTDEDKKECLEEHLVYELKMFSYSFEQLNKCINTNTGEKSYHIASGSISHVEFIASTLITGSFLVMPSIGNIGQTEKPLEDRNFTNMALETFLLHARNLREFFYGEKQFQDDARAYQFFTDKECWKKIRPGETDSIKEVTKRGNKELAHLTYKRISGTPPEKGWDCRKIRSDFLEVVKVFLDKLPEKYSGKNLNDLKSEMKQFLSCV